MLWISIMPVVIILSVGTKLQGIICRMAIDITERHAVVQGIPLVQVSDSYFWFSKPTFVLFLIHFTLFQVRPCCLPLHCISFMLYYLPF
jgi:mlo protein